ncbi:aspartate--tRNA ligase [Candidatus Woesearchaeota archaeon]|nr:MAG: aspartate--tRNA ligase [Candidatus Woesearchaeota archaeon]
MKRTHTCGELIKADIGKDVVLSGWVQSRRDHGGVIFIDLRDKYGLTQVVFDPSHNSKVHEKAEHLGREFVLQIKGKVRARKEGMVNPKLPTGEVEVLVDDLVILNASETPPMEIDDRKVPSEEVRLKYRYLDLRRPTMQSNFLARHKAMQAARQSLVEQGFMEIETPLLVRNTPEGARDYIVPSRVNPGKIYSLPQSPQLYKQILMVSGFDRYFQLAKCLRDEDLRADRQPEFTQIDLEMSFVDQEDVWQVVENIISNIFEKAFNKKIATPFKRLTYNESMKKYGTDKPDLRFGLELIDVTKIFSRSNFSIIKSAIDKGGVVKCINVKGGAKISRKTIDSYIEFVKIYKANGLAWMKMNDKLESSVVKFFSEDLQSELIDKVKAEKGDLLLFVADKKEKIVNTSLAELRNKLGKDLSLYNPEELNFVWITDFPLFEWDDDLEQYVPAHHMFTMPNEDTINYLESEPGKVIALCYDLVLNGVELGSGSIRVHRKDIQQRIMKAMKITEEEAEEKFGFLLEAFRYGAPPHGGFAIGFDRLVALALGIHDIREVIAFPKNKSAQCPMDGCPSSVSNEDLKEVHLRWDIVKKK